MNNAIFSYQSMDGPRDYYIKWCESDRERQIANNITCMWNLKYDYVTEIDSDIETDLPVTVCFHHLNETHWRNGLWSIVASSITRIMPGM